MDECPYCGSDDIIVADCRECYGVGCDDCNDSGLSDDYYECGECGEVFE
jgi:hypothetical protein